MGELYLVTGGAGFIGSHVVEYLLDEGARVRILDNFSSGKEDNLQDFVSKVELLRGDVTSEKDCVAALKGVDRVIHLAAQASVARSVEAPLETHEMNATGTLRMLEAARHARVKGFAFASTCAVYGNTETLPISETAPTRPLSPYAASKLCAEYYVSLYASLYGVPAVIYRLFNVYGPRQDPGSPYSGVISAFANALARGTDGTIYGDGKQTRDFIFVKDVARAFGIAAAAPQRFVEPVYHLANEGEISILELYATLARLAGKPCAPKMATARSGEVRHSRGSTRRLMEVLGEDERKQRVPLEEGLRRTFSAYR